MSNQAITGLTAAINIMRAVRPDAVEAFKRHGETDGHAGLAFGNGCYDVDFIIAGGFSWKHTSEGHDYWRKVLDDVREYMGVWYA